MGWGSLAVFEGNPGCGGKIKNKKQTIKKLCLWGRYLLNLTDGVTPALFHEKCAVKGGGMGFLHYLKDPALQKPVKVKIRCAKIKGISLLPREAW